MFARRLLTIAINLALVMTLLTGGLGTLSTASPPSGRTGGSVSEHAMQEHAMQEHSMFLPMVATNHFSSPGDDLVVSWAQRVEEGERQVLLYWREPVEVAAFGMATVSGAASGANMASGYNVYRQQVDVAGWQHIGATSFAADADAMVAILGDDLTAQLGYDLRPSSKDVPLAPQEIYDRLKDDPGIRQLVAGQYYQVAQATGTAYLDLDAVLGSAYEYRVEPVGGHGKFSPAFVPKDGTPPLPTPTGLSEVWTGPAALGVRPSSRPNDAAERYDWFGAQSYRTWDGTVYLIWDIPAQGVDNSGQITDAYDSLGTRGYRVYRAPHGTQSWASVNPVKADCTPSKLHCEMLVGFGTQVEPKLASTDFPDYFFKEDLHAVYSDPAQIYTQWDYKVCPVDLFWQDGPCSAVLTVDVRELQPPAPVNDTILTLDGLSTQSELYFTWNYSDTLELSPPLRFYVTRSPTLTLPAEQWTPIIPQGSSNPYQESPTTGPVTLSITDAPPKDQVYWYRVQVRDDAGNWSAPGLATKGALYDRVAPTLSPIPHDPAECANNPMPFTLTGLTDDVLQLALYRSFDPTGPWQLIKRITVNGGSAVISDDYVPPYGTDVYYEIEAIDGHGNVSDAQSYCANLDGAPVSPPAPPVTVTAHYPIDADPYWEIEVGEGIADSDGLTPTIEITQPGENGPISFTLTLTETVEGELPPGWIQIDASLTGELAGMPMTYWFYETNNFLGVNRQLTDLHDLYDSRWMTDSVTGEHYVALRIVDKAVGFSPPVAVFRRIPGGNWMQIDGVGPRWKYVIEDRSDPSPDQTYEYVVLLLGPETYEMLGFWGPTQVGPLVSTPHTSHLSTSISRVAGPPRSCSYTRLPAKSMGMPTTITLANGWVINDVYYWTSSDPDCPSEMSSFDAAHAYGDGNLYNGRQEWPIEFYDIGVHITTGAHKTGRIVGTLDKSLVASAARFASYFEDIEFQPLAVRAEVTITLPDNIALDFPEEDRASKLFAVVDDVTPLLSFDPFSLNSDTILIDENLPWELHCSSMALREHAITFGSPVTAMDRLGYTPMAGQPNNNLAFLQATYTASSAIVRSQGLIGSFQTSDPLSYTTSLPAWIAVQALNGASVTIDDSTITGGTLYGGSASLKYAHDGMNSEYAVYGQDCAAQPNPYHAVCQWTTGAGRRQLAMTPLGEGEHIGIGAGGLLTAPVTLDRKPLWPMFKVHTHSATLYVAAAAFPDNPSSWAPMPAENAWLELPHAATGGTLDPGVNINALEQRTDYTQFEPPDFDDSDMDLYVRWAGVSGHLIVHGDAISRTEHNYEVVVHSAEFLFVDNAAVTSTVVTDLYLPYPTDKTFLRIQQGASTDNVLNFGEFREPTVALHKYWKFTETPTTWAYVDVSGLDYGTSLGGQDMIFRLVGSRATITGLGPSDKQPGTASVELAFDSEWLHDGDIGALRLQPPPELGYLVSGFDFSFTGVHLSRYYSVPLDENSLPDTVGIDVDRNLDSLPAQMLNSSGDLTGQSLKACSAGGTVGCGFVVLDGNVYVDYFGGVEPMGPAGYQAAGTTAPTVGVADILSGTFPIAVTQLISVTKQVAAKSALIPWAWPVVNEVLDMELPLKFLGNTQGGAFVALRRNAPVFPENGLFKGDLAAVITMHWDGATGAEDQFGIFLGYPASQAAFRALAMNRPTWTGGVLPYDQWSDVEADIRLWSEKFGYTAAGHNYDADTDDDPVDLAKMIWNDWGGRTFEKTYGVIKPFLMDWAQDGADDAYGVTSLKAGSGLLPAKASMSNGALAADFMWNNNGYQMRSLEGGTQIAYDVYEYDLVVTDLDVFLEVDWVSVEMNRDGEVMFYGEPHLNLIGDDLVGVDGTFFGMAFPEGDEWRVEAAVDLKPLGLAGVSELKLAGEFGSGPYNGEMVSYLSVRGEGYYSSYRVGGGVLYGAIYDSPFLRNAGYGELLDTLGGQNTYTGFYVYLTGSYSFVEGDSCALDASAEGALRAWYYWSNDVYGGKLTAAVYATVACVISGRGQLDLTYARLDNGGQLEGRTCGSAHCDAFGGGLWVAVGVGWCSPGSWDSWWDRWWGDSWCWCVGAYVNLTYFNPGGLESEVDFDYE